MNKNESKYFSTAILFDEALIYLLEKKDIEYITIKEICNKAGVNRSTFYLHYESINDLIDECMEYINSKFLKCFNKNSKDLICQIKKLSLEEINFIKDEYLKPYLTFIKDNKKIFIASLSNPNGMKSIQKFNKLKEVIILHIMERFQIPKEERKYLLAFYVQGIIAIINEWLKDNCSDEIEKIERLIIECVMNKK